MSDDWEEQKRQAASAFTDKWTLAFMMQKRLTEFTERIQGAFQVLRGEALPIDTERAQTMLYREWEDHQDWLESQADWEEYQKNRAREAEKYVAFIQEARDTLGDRHSFLTYPLTGLGDLYFHLDRDQEAESVYKQAISIWEEQPTENHFIMYPLSHLGATYIKLGRYEEGLPLLERAEQIAEKESWVQLKSIINYMGFAYTQQEKYEEAEALYKRKIALVKEHSPLRALPDRPIFSLNFGPLESYSLEEAQELYQQTLKEHHLENWQETKHQMQGAIEMRVGKSTEVDWQRLSDLELSHSIAQDGITHNVERDIEKDIEPERDRDLEPDL